MEFFHTTKKYQVANGLTGGHVGQGLIFLTKCCTAIVDPESVKRSFMSPSFTSNKASICCKGLVILLENVPLYRLTFSGSECAYPCRASYIYWFICLQVEYQSPCFNTTVIRNVYVIMVLVKKSI